MGWFENQIEERRRADQQLLEDSFVRIAGAIMGEGTARKISDERIITKNAIDEILKYYHFKAPEVPDSIKDPDEQLDYCLRPHGLMRRTVELKEGWYKEAYGPILALTREGGEAVALLPDRIYGYHFKDPETGKRKRINKKTEGLFREEAICFYRPLPQKSLGIPDLLLYMRRCIEASDVIFLALATLVVTLVGMLMPRLMKLLTGPVLTSRQADALISIAVCMTCVAISSQLFTSVQGMVQGRLDTKTSMGVQAAMMLRLLALPADFYRKYSPGELRSRSMAVNELCSRLMNLVVGTGLTSIASLLYITQIFQFAPALVVPALICILLTEGLAALSILVQVRIDRKQMNLEARESGMSYSLITGVQKIKLAGAEKRLFAKWMDCYTGVAELEFNPPLFIKLNGVINTAIELAFSIVFYYIAVSTRVDQSSYFAFMTAYGTLMGAISAFADTALSVAQIKPILEMAQPFLKTAPETTEDKEIVTRISGGIDIEHVSFRYHERGPWILKDLSLKIKSGEYVAIVGRTGCGKSTLMRLLLGFEKPEKGVIYYDGKDMNSLDLPSLRSKIGTVLQDAGLFQGDIYSNIVISAPKLGLSDAWEAAEKVGIADDIRDMPMGMHTIISEGQGGISGGQRQRIMIARAIAPKPKLLLFDEATSALDNRTQRQVSEALDGMGCTRLVIAHRLSTIRHCDRILVLNDGRISEEGTYDELISRGGYFAELVERQRLDYGEKDL